VTATMILASAMAFFVIWKLWKWPLWMAAGTMAPLILIEQVFFAANMTKIWEGGWLPLLIAGTVALVIVTWLKGSRVLAR
ncbi:KUP/HAK/KT family potassium transporter, partial [Escherichia coli]